MSFPERAEPVGAAPAASPWRALPLAFAAVIFVSAFMLFSVQPMFTKMVLPALGGSPGVWSVAMAFFQTLLLIGYLYAHLSARWLTPGQALAVHGVLLAAAFMTLPLSVSQLLGGPPESGQSLWLVGTFAASVGLPFLVLAATAPLLQTWFSRSGHPEAANPYKLYVASNLGSFCALLAYPAAIEPLLPLRLQSEGWMLLFAALGLCIGACGVLTLRSADPARTSPDPRAEAVPAVTWRQRAAWAALAGVPSGLLVAVTAHLTTDVASAPFLWVAPLALFLLTFVLAFRDRELIGEAMLSSWFARIAPFVALSLIGYVLPLSMQFAVHFGCLFLAAMLCHRALYLRRPAPAQLTEFYLWMSFGGMLGGLFAGLAAPMLFDTILEYRILLVGALLCLAARPGAPDRRTQGRYAAAAVGVAMTASLVVPRIGALDADIQYAIAFAIVLGFLAIVVFNRYGPIASAGAAAAAFIASAPLAGQKPEAVVRSFFGVNQVRLDETGTLRILKNGSTIHGAHRLAGEDGKPLSGRPQPTAYYHDGGGINLALVAARAAAGGRLGEVAVIGLGAGAMACQAAQGENWSYFEIDSEVAKLALRKDLFPFLDACTPGARIVIGDGRLTIQKETTKFDAIILDAFSSDSVPAHLLTKEAFAAYERQLKPGGVVIAHVSNLHLDLAPVVEAAARAIGMEAASAFIAADLRSPLQRLQYAAHTKVVALSRSEEFMARLLTDARWRKGAPTGRNDMWTDDYANVLGAMLRHTFGRKGAAPDAAH